ncbi:MAG: restriction endonuclease subunit [Bacteroidota bacterium]|nr:restriction endonuclease subunit [Bacteroidota bacterium]
MSDILNNAIFYSDERVSISKLSFYNYVTTDNLLQNKLGKVNVEKLPSKGGNVTKFSEGDILISNIRPYLKKIWLAKYDGGSSSDVLTFKVKPNYDPAFVYYSLYRDDFFDYVMKGSKGTKMPRGDKKQILNFQIPNFEKNVQQKIAKVLSDLDAKIELNNKINLELEAMAKTLYDYWFVQFDFPDANGKPYKTSGGKMVWNEELKRSIPEGWEVKTIGEAAEIKAGGDKPKDYSVDKSKKYSIPIYSNGISNEGLYGFTDKAKIIKQSLTISARGTIGYCVLRNKPFVPIIRLIVITPNFSYELKYFYEFIKNIEFENSGSVQQQLTVPQISSLNIILPSIEILKKYELMTLSGINKIEINKEENQELSSLRDWLLPMLMNGQVSVGGVAKEYKIEEEVLGRVAELIEKYS